MRVREAPERSGVNVRPGSVRQARMEAGLSLASVAGDDITRSAIHRIESGKVRPSMRTLQLIADRTGKTLDFFLDDAEPAQAVHDGRLELGIAHLQRLCFAEDFESVLAEGPVLLEGPVDPASEGQVRFLLGQAHARMAQPAEA